MKHRVTIRSYNFVTDEIEAPAGITEDNLREILLGRVERGELAWDTDYAETTVVPLFEAIEDTPAPADPTSPDHDAGAP